MKIHILTFHDGINYGAFAQVYSLQRALTSLGHVARVLNYKSPLYWARERAHFLMLDGRPLENAVRIARFSKQRRELLRETGLTFAINGGGNHGDALCIGSDEVWNLHNPGFGFNPSYFGRGAEVKKVAYAASFGSTTLSSPRLPLIKEDLGRFRCVSVRDRNSMEIVRSLGVNDAELVPDPTILVEQDSFAVDPISLHKYILVYSATNITLDRQQWLRAYANKHDLRLIAVGYRQDWVDENICRVGPTEWAGLIRCADAVYTTMYHGTLFSVIYEKPFIYDLTLYRANKFSTLVEQLGIQKHCWDGGGSGFIKYECDERFFQYRENGLNYLRKSFC